MNIYILGKLGKLTQNEWQDRVNASVELEKEGKESLNYNTAAMIFFEDKALQLVNEIAYLLSADAVYLVKDFNECEDARLLLAMAIRMHLPITAAKNCIIPARISFTTNF